MANTRNYRTPTEDDDADVPYWNDALAQDVANDVDGLVKNSLILRPVTGPFPAPTADEVVTLVWTEKSLDTPYSDTYTSYYEGEVVYGDQVSGELPVLTADGMIPETMLPDVETTPLPANMAVTDGTVPFDIIRLPHGVLLKVHSGARGRRFVYEVEGTTEDDRPYMEVNNNKDTDKYGDVIAGYQSHVTGNGETPNNQERVYWFMEWHGLQHTVNANPDFEGWASMGVSNRAELTERGKGRAFILDAGNRPGLAFHFYKPYVELNRNTAIILDDRARPAFGDGVGAHHEAQGVGTIHGGDYINLRREGALGLRLTSLSDTASTAPNLFHGRSRGTVTAPANVQSGDRLSALQAGTQTTVDADYVHIPGNGSDPRNQKRVTAQILAVATENFTPTTAEGSRYDLEVTPNGTAAKVVGLSVDGNTAAGQTSILVRVNRDGTTTQSRVEVGPADSAGTGYRSLRVPN